MPPWLVIVLGLAVIFLSGLTYAAYRITKGGQEAGRIDKSD